MNAIQAADSVDLIGHHSDITIPMTPDQVYAVNSALSLGAIDDLPSLVEALSEHLGGETQDLLRHLHVSTIEERIADAKLDPEDKEFLEMVSSVVRQRQPLLVQRALEAPLVAQGHGLPAIALLVVAVAVFVAVLSR